MFVTMNALLVYDCSCFTYNQTSFHRSCKGTVHRTSIVMLRVIYFSWVFIIISPNPSVISLFSILLFHIFENARACLCLFCFCQSAEWRNCRVRLLSVLKSRLQTKIQTFKQKININIKNNQTKYIVYTACWNSPLLLVCGLVWIGLDWLARTGV